MEMRKRLTWCGLASACVFSVGMLLTADAQDAGQVSVSVSTEAVGITITGGAINWGAQPHHADLRAHPNPGAASASAVPPVIQNSGNVPITHIDVRYDGPAGSEAMCDGGTASWAATTATTPGENEFRMQVWASENDVYGGTGFTAQARVVPVGNGTPNILDGGPIEPDEDVPLLLRLRTANPGTVGAQGCTITLVVTASQ
jgi:hypothetical protein